MTWMIKRVNMNLDSLMKISEGIKRLSVLAVLAIVIVQISGLTCIGEYRDGTVPSAVVGKADLSGNPDHSPGYNTGVCGCPCHGGFISNVKSHIVAFTPMILKVTSMDHQFVTTSGLSLFRPPKKHI